MAAIRLKYRIGEIFAGMTQQARINRRKEIIKCLKVNDATFSRWINANEHESQDIDGYSLAIIARLLNVTVDELYNENLVFEKTLQNFKK